MTQKRFKWRTQYDNEADEQIGLQTSILCEEETMTVQDLPDIDINELIKKFGINDGSVLPATLGVYDPRYYGDFSDMPDLRTSLDQIREAEQRFGQLPAEIRSRFHNDYRELYDWISDPANGEEAVTLKLLSKEEPPPPAAGGNTSANGGT